MKEYIVKEIFTDGFNSPIIYKLESKDGDIIYKSYKDLVILLDKCEKEGSNAIKTQFKIDMTKVPKAEMLTDLGCTATVEYIGPKLKMGIRKLTDGSRVIDVARAFDAGFIDEYIPEVMIHRIDDGAMPSELISLKIGVPDKIDQVWNLYTKLFTENSKVESVADSEATVWEYLIQHSEPIKVLYMLNFKHSMKVSKKKVKTGVLTFGGSGPKVYYTETLAICEIGDTEKTKQTVILPLNTIKSNCRGKIDYNDCKGEVELPWNLFGVKIVDSNYAYSRITLELNTYIAHLINYRPYEVRKKAQEAIEQSVSETTHKAELNSANKEIEKLKERIEELENEVKRLTIANKVLTETNKKLQKVNAVKNKALTDTELLQKVSDSAMKNEARFNKQKYMEGMKATAGVQSQKEKSIVFKHTKSDASLNNMILATEARYNDLMENASSNRQKSLINKEKNDKIKKIKEVYKKRCIDLNRDYEVKVIVRATSGNSICGAIIESVSGRGETREHTISRKTLDALVTAGKITNVYHYNRSLINVHNSKSITKIVVDRSYDGVTIPVPSSTVVDASNLEEIEQYKKSMTLSSDNIRKVMKTMEFPIVNIMYGIAKLGYTEEKLFNECLKINTVSELVRQFDAEPMEVVKELWKSAKRRRKVLVDGDYNSILKDAIE